MRRFSAANVQLKVRHSIAHLIDDEVPAAVDFHEFTSRARQLTLTPCPTPRVSRYASAFEPLSFDGPREEFQSFEPFVRAPAIVEEATLTVVVALPSLMR